MPGGGPTRGIDAEADPGCIGRVDDAWREVLAVEEHDVAAGLVHDRARVLAPDDADGP